MTKRLSLLHIKLKLILILWYHLIKIKFYLLTLYMYIYVCIHFGSVTKMPFYRWSVRILTDPR